ncbi:MAG: hypothetical protein HQ592_16735 [Planctomycetes bacterium]|nr:hypothetical protein [Planctomycetota bacterium]
MSEPGMQLRQWHIEHQSKYTYFLLFIAASAVGFAVQKTTGRCLDWSLLPLGGAVLSWAGSFFAGCHTRSLLAKAISANIQVLDAGNSNQSQSAQNRVRQYSYVGGRWFKWQFRLLVLGAVLFIVWHVIVMAGDPSIQAVDAAPQGVVAVEGH